MPAKPGGKGAFYKEEGYSEPQKVKGELLDDLFMAANLFGTLRYYKRFKHVNNRRIAAQFEAVVVSLFLKVKPKHGIKGEQWATEFNEKIFNGKAFTDEELNNAFSKLTDVLQDLGPLKFEINKSVNPKYSFMEERITGK